MGSADTLLDRAFFLPLLLLLDGASTEPAREEAILGGAGMSRRGSGESSSGCCCLAKLRSEDWIAGFSVEENVGRGAVATAGEEEDA